MIITSRQNPFIRKIKKLLKSNSERLRTGEMVAEGIHIIQEALKFPEQIVSIIVTEDSSFKNSEISKIINQTVILQLDLKIIDSKCYNCFTQLKSPEGAAVILRKHECRFADFESFKKIIILDRIQDPGNAGTIIRTAAAAGFDAAVFTEGCCDSTHPFFLRATMGTFFKIFIKSYKNKEVIDFIKNKEINFIAATAGKNIDYKEADYTQPLALIIGNEGDGIAEELKENSSQLVSIPMEDSVESLNAASAAALLIYETLRS